MDALLLHLDEELTNNRPGHSYRTNLKPRDLAFWLNFYSLFFDRVFVPANFLTDSNLVPEILDTLGSFFFDDDHPLWVLWDQERFPYDSFGDLVAAIESSDASDVSLRDVARSSKTATLCDQLPKHRVPRRAMSVAVHNDESIRILQRTVFSADTNVALSSEACRRLNDAMTAIQDRSAAVGYGRNFFYTVFGYGRSEADAAVAKRFADVTASLGDLRHAFLAGVDYASHTIKAALASNAMSVDIHCLLPSPYRRIYRRVLADEMWREETDELTIETPERHRYLLDPSAVVALDAQKFRVLRASDEFGELRALLAACASDASASPMAEPERIAKALDAYLGRITSTLTPVRVFASNVLETAGRVRLSGRGYAVGIALLTAGSQVAPEPIASFSRTGAEIFAYHAAAAQGADLARRVLRTAPILPAEGFQLSRDVEVRFKRMDPAQ